GTAIGSHYDAPRTALHIRGGCETLRSGTPAIPRGPLRGCPFTLPYPRRRQGLEIGCGTGQATLPLARRGLRMLCLEPGPSLARLAHLKLASFKNVEVVSQTFEGWPLEAGAFRLVISAQAFHWVAPEVRFAKAAAALQPGGALAVFGNVQIFNRSAVREALDKVYALHAPSLAGPSPTRWYAEDGPIPRLFAESACFGPVTWRRYPWSQEYAPAEYVDLLVTSSDHRLLPPGQRETLLHAVRQAIEMHGG